MKQLALCMSFYPQVDIMGGETKLDHLLRVNQY